MKERNLTKSIAIYIDDVHIPTQLENLIYFMENQVCYENNNHRFVEWVKYFLPFFFNFSKYIVTNNNDNNYNNY